MIMNLDKKIWQWGALFLLAFVWGASFILMKKGLVAFSYTQVGALRMFFCFLILLPLSLKNLKYVNKKNIGWLITSGLVGNFFPAILFCFAQTHIKSSMAGILNGLTPFFVLLAGVVVFKNRPTALQYIGILTGFIGASLLVTGGNFHSLGSVNGYALFIVLATLMYGFNANVIKYKLKDLNGLQLTSLYFFLTGPLALCVLLFTDFAAPFAQTEWLPSLTFIFILALFGSVLSLILYNNLIHRCGPIFSSSTTYIVPFFALMWGILDGETISMAHLYGLGIILTGVYLSSFRKAAENIAKK